MVFSHTVLQTRRLSLCLETDVARQCTVQPASEAASRTAVPLASELDEWYEQCRVVTRGQPGGPNLEAGKGCFPGNHCSVSSSKNIHLGHGRVSFQDKPGELVLWSIFTLPGKTQYMLARKQVAFDYSLCPLLCLGSDNGHGLLLPCLLLRGPVLWLSAQNCLVFSCLIINLHLASP